MPQQQSPFLEGKYGWNFGESGWNTGMDENLLKFSYMFDRNVDGIVSSLPAAVNGQAYFLTTDNRLYFAVGNTWYSSPVPKWFEFKIRATGDVYQFNGTSAIQIDNPSQIGGRLDSVEATIASLGSAAFEDVADLATQAELDIVSAQANDYVDTLRTDLTNPTDPSKGAALVGYNETDVYTALSAAHPIVLSSASDIASAGLNVGARCSVNGTVFEISAEAPRSSRYPLISAGAGLYAIPVENHTNNIIGTYVSKGGVVSASDWALADSRQQQGMEYDNRAGTVFMTSLVRPSSPEVGYLIEYEAGGPSKAPTTLAKILAGSASIVCYGDSVTYGEKGEGGGQSANPYPKLLQAGLRAQYGEGATVINSGNNGWQTDEALAGFSAQVAAHNPDLTVIMFGINDCRGSGAGGAAIPVGQYRTNLEALIEQCLAIGSEVVVLPPTPVVNGTAPTLGDYVTAASQAAAAKGVPYFDLNQAIATLLSTGLETNASLLPDGVHFADAKNYHIAEPVLAAIFPTAGHVGAEIRRSGLLPMGHSDYFAVEYDPADGKRYVWVSEVSSGSLHRIEWKAGATSADIKKTIDFNSIAAGRIEVSLYGSDCLLLSFTRVDTGRIVDHVCKLSDLAEGIFAPAWQGDVAPRLHAVVPIMPHQQRKHEGGAFVGLCGLDIDTPDYCFVSAGTESGEVLGRGSYYNPAASAGDEPEGLAWYWSEAHAKLLPVMSIWQPAGGVSLYGLAEPGAALTYAHGAGQFTHREWNTSGTGTGQWGVQASGLSADFPVSVRQLFVGGGSYITDDKFNPVNLRLTQVFDNATRQGGGVYAYGQANVLIFDGPNDLTYGVGLRWLGATRTMMHITESGAFFGRTATLAEKAANKASLNGFGTAEYPVGVRGKTGNGAAAPCFLSEGGALDYAVPATEAMQLGGYDASAGTIATWMAINSSSIQPGADNSRSCGIASLRWSVVHAGTGTINTSDEREKQQIRELSDAERAVALRLKRLIRAFKFNDAVEEKGDKARIHFGVIAQEVKAAFESEGLVAEDYAILCYDEWPEQPEVMDDDGNITQEFIPAGDRYGVRYEELLAFIVSVL